MTITETTTGSIYVGTYAKYNNGSIDGKWLDLSNYDNAQQFYTACHKLHKDEHDPEFMFQDWENIPDQFISECSIDNKYWEYIELVNESGLSQQAFEAGIACGIDTNSIEDAYVGEYESDQDFAWELATDCGFEESNTWPHSCIDWKKAAYELMFDYSTDNGFYFTNNY